MRNLLITSVALVAVLGVVSGNLWLELRAARQELADLQARLEQPVPAAAPESPMRPVQAMTATAAVPEVTSQPVVTQPATRPAVVAPPPVPVAAQSRFVPVITEAVRTDALLQSERTATARTMAWRDRLAVAGHTLTTEQLQALNAAATAQLRRETEESLEQASVLQPTDPEAFLRFREDTINRQNDTNLRILADVSPHLTAEQAKALRSQFETGHASRMAAFRAEQEAIRQAR